MADHTKIEWSDATWNPIAGCSRVSEGCRHCYAESIAARFSADAAYAGTARFVDRPDGTREARWTSKIVVREHLLTQPLRWRRPRRIFVNSMSDLFHDAVPEEVIDAIFAVMALASQHTFQILTKRPERMRRYLTSGGGRSFGERPLERVHLAASDIDSLRNLKKYGNLYSLYCSVPWPLPNVWLGDSVEDQVTADIRRPYLKSVAEAGWNTFVSYEPALGYVDWHGWEFIKWLISGGESGPNARPSHPDWHREARDFAAANDIPYLFKQWGEWTPGENVPATITGRRPSAHWWDERWLIGSTNMSDPEDGWDDEPDVYRVGKRAAGRWLDGVVHNGMPALSAPHEA